MRATKFSLNGDHIMKKKYPPKWAIRHAVTGKYMSFAKDGNHHWRDEWKHATKFISHYQAKLFMEEHVILMCYPELVLGTSNEKVDYSINM
jgi:hypothetical protein